MNAHAEIRRRRSGFHRKGIMWEFNRDGQSPYDRVKGFWKQYWKRWERRVTR